MAVSIVIVGGLMVASLRVVGAAVRTDQLTMDASRGRLLAEDLMAEIVLKAYSEPSGGTAIGPNGGEVSGSSRRAFGWSC